MLDNEHDISTCYYTLLHRKVHLHAVTRCLFCVGSMLSAELKPSQHPKALMITLNCCETIPRILNRQMNISSKKKPIAGFAVMKQLLFTCVMYIYTSHWQLLYPNASHWQLSYSPGLFAASLSYSIRFHLLHLTRTSGARGRKIRVVMSMESR